MRRIMALLLAALLLGLVGCGGTEETAAAPTPTAPLSTPPAAAETTAPEEEAAEAEPPAVRRTLAADCEGEEIPYINDESDSAITRLWAGYPVTVRSLDGPMTQLYIKWDSVPGEWTLRCGGAEYVCGREGILHEYVALPEPCEELEITLQDGWHYVCAVCAFSDGALPDWVQRWEVSEEKADLLVVSTHNDDDVLFFGGLEPYYAGELGYEVQVVYLTNHWNERERTHEALNGLWTMGVTRYPVIGGFEDVASMSLYQAQLDYDSYYVLQYLTGEIRRFRPDVIVGQAENGEYGHGVHQLCVVCLKKAVALAADAEAYPESAQRYGTWDTPKTYLHLYGAADERTIMDWDMPLAAFGGLTAFQVAERAYACHVSQHPDRRFFVYPRDNEYTCYEFGLFRSLVGADEARNDLFEHLDG